MAVPRSHSFGPVVVKQLPPAPVSGRTPGRRGEKRRRPEDEGDDQKKRKNGKVVLDREPPRALEGDAGGEEDIFGKHTAVKSGIKFELPLPSKAGERGDGGDQEQGRLGEEPPSTAKKRPRVPQQVLDNKAVSHSSPVTVASLIAF